MGAKKKEPIKESLTEANNTIEVGDHVANRYQISPWKVIDVLENGDLQVMFNGVEASKRVLKKRLLKDYNFVRLIKGDLKKL